MDQIEINNPFAKDVPDEMIEDILKGAIGDLKESDRISKKQSVHISVALVGKKDIAKLNKQYRKKDSSTDVLSFCYNTTDSQISGEIILSPDVIKKYAKEDGEDFQKELKKNIVHGLLHIVGQEHGDEMFEIQANLLKK